MKLHLSRQADGRYMLTASRPILTTVRGTRHEDYYAEPGDPVGVRHLCPEMVRLLLGTELDPMGTARIEIEARLI